MTLNIKVLLRTDNYLTLRFSKNGVIYFDCDKLNIVSVFYDNGMCDVSIKFDSLDEIKKFLRELYERYDYCSDMNLEYGWYHQGVYHSRKIDFEDFIKP